VDSWRGVFEASLGADVVGIWVLQFLVWLEMHSDLLVAVGFPDKFCVWAWKEALCNDSCLWVVLCWSHLFLDSSSHMLQVNCMQFPPAGLFAEFWNLVLHLSTSLHESLLLNAAVPSSFCRPQHLAFLKCDLVLSGMCAHAGSASHAGPHPPTVSPFSSRTLSPSHSWHFWLGCPGTESKQCWLHQKLD